MAITSAVCNSFKQECMLGEHDLDTDVLKIALFTSSATLGADTTAYATTNEVVGTGYTAGGETLTTVAVTLDGAVAIVDFDNVTWSSADFTARGALIYNSSKSNKAVAVFNFGSDRTASDGDFVVVVPAAAAATAVIRLS
jgi:hypothetical protein